MSALVYLLCGLPGAGKSTWCKTYYNNLPVVSRDIIRADLGYIKLGEKAVLSKDQESKVTKTEYARITDLCNSGVSFIIDDTNLGGKFRDQLLDLLRNLKVKIIGVNFHTPVDLCIRRRKDQIPEDAMRKLAGMITYLTKEEVDHVIEV